MIGFYIALKALVRLIKKDYYDPMRDTQEEVQAEEKEHTKDETEQDATEKTDE